jgi:hypothetical protein
MKLPEIIFVVLFLLASVLRIFHVPGSIFLTLIALVLLSSYYMLFGFWAFSHKDKKTQVTENILGLSIPAGFFAALGIVGVLFKLMLWPGASFGLIIGGFSLTLMYLIATGMLFVSEKKIFLRNIIIRMVVLSFVCYAMFFVSGKTIYRMAHSNDPELIRLWENHINNPSDSTAQRMFEDYISRQQ